MTDHFVDIVDENDQVVGKELKSKKPELNFISRTVSVFIVNSKNKISVCRRGHHKKNDPNVYDVSAYGNVVAGESCEQAAKRELLEELGIDCPLIFLDKYYREIDKNGQKTSKIFCSIFLGKSDQEPRLNHELSEFKWLNFTELKDKLENDSADYCPGLKDDFTKVKNELLNYLEA